ncbi:MAG: hypothetical protein ACYTG4_16675, partial [Planctomycetota bacterium]
WHLLCVEPDEEDPGDDYDTLVRRFRAFTGPADREPVIRNGLARLDLQGPPWSVPDVRRVNEVVAARAVDRDGLRERWKTALDLAGPDARLVEEVRVPGDFLPRWGIMRSGRYAFLWNLVFGLTIYGCHQVVQHGSMGAGDTAAAFRFWAALVVILSLPWTLMTTWRVLQHCTWSFNMRRTGRALLEALHSAGLVTSDPKWMTVHAEHRDVDGEVRVDGWLSGGTAYDRSLWADTLAELLDPISRVRYVLRYAVPFRMPWAPTLFYAVPKLLGKGKAEVGHLEFRWRRRVGPVEAVYIKGDGDGVDVGLWARSESRRRARGRTSERVVVWR